MEEDEEEAMRLRDGDGERGEGEREGEVGRILADDGRESMSTEPCVVCEVEEKGKETVWTAMDRDPCVTRAVASDCRRGIKPKSPSCISMEGEEEEACDRKKRMDSTIQNKLLDLHIV